MLDQLTGFQYCNECNESFGADNRKSEYREIIYFSIAYINDCIKQKKHTNLLIQWNVNKNVNQIG